MGKDYRYNIKFNPENGKHLRASEILDSVGVRQKAQLVAEALVAYVDGDKSEHVSFQPMITREDIRKMVVEILGQQEYQIKPPEIEQPEEKAEQQPSAALKEHMNKSNNAEKPKVSDKVVNAVLNGLQGFM